MRKIRVLIHRAIRQEEKLTEKRWEGRRKYQSIGKKYDDGAYIFQEKHNDQTWQWWQCDTCEVQSSSIKSYISLALDGGLIHNVQAHGWKNSNKMREKMRKRIFFEGGYKY